MSTYAPGTVAKVTDADGTVRTMMLVPGCWHGVAEDGGLRCLDATQAEDVRPLVVIDPGDPEQVTGLVIALAEQGWTPTTAHGARGALRSLVADPKPEEPTIVAAMVEDRDGAIWARQCSRSRGRDMSLAWIRVANGRVPGSADRERGYAEIAAVRVLNDGVTA